MDRRPWGGLLLGVILGLPVLAAAETTYRAEYDAQSGQVLVTLDDILPAVKFQREEGWIRVEAEGLTLLRTEEPDRPELPCREYWLSVPAGSRFVGLEVKAERTESVLPGRIKPVRKPYIPQPGVVPPALSADSSVYDSADEYPAAWSEAELFRAGSTTILRLKVFLYKYLGTEKKLVAYRNPKLLVRLDVPDWQPVNEPKNAVDRELRRRLVNPDEAFFQQPLR